MDRQFRHGVLRLPHARLRETLRRSGLVDTASQFFPNFAIPFMLDNVEELNLLAARVLLVDVTRVVVVVFARDHSPVVYCKKVHKRNEPSNSSNLHLAEVAG